MLHCNESHGYELRDGLSGFWPSGENFNLSTVYRVLRSLEQEGYISSRWETGSSGPARRLYSLTPAGDSYLAWWVNDLEEMEKLVSRFMEAYRNHMSKHAEESES